MSAYLDAQMAARRAIHAQFAVPAVFYPLGSDVGTDVMVRWHPRVSYTGFGDSQNQGYGQTLEAANRVVFDAAEIATKSLLLISGARVSIPSARTEWFVLSTAEDIDGPVNRTWVVE